ncbi:hypothetical protein RHGRI_007921 [Rhododendron griersonianum]|uniref:Small subunit processome component 20 homolog n=1 Tax=Rhododendron griersonianum TaxID=479676 RepID=A0AAV6KYW2_9ERIC|nr:hypothetical protein RHGRI_007921 [Rhododendron griersonianum]
MKNTKLHKKDEQQLKMLDPFVILLTECLTSKYDDIIFDALRYAHSVARETVLEMLHAFVIKFPKHILDEHFNTIFMNLVLILANDNDNNVRSMTGAAVKLLIGHLGLSVEATDCSWKETYYSLILLKKILHQFLGLCLAGHLEFFKAWLGASVVGHGALIGGGLGDGTV